MISRRVDKWFIGLAILSIFTILATGCVIKNAPIIISLMAEREVVPPSYPCQIECNASSPEGGKLNYEWSTTGGNVTGESAIVIWNAPEELGNYTISVDVTDEEGNKATRSIAVTVGDNELPEIIDLEASEEWVVPSGNCTIECNASDPEGSSLSYRWSASEGDITGEGDSVTWIAPEEVGNYNITVVVTDDMGSERTASLPIKVAINHPPCIQNLIVTPRNPDLMKGNRIFKGASCDIECVAFDEDDDKLNYVWSANGGRISGEGSVITWTAPLRSTLITITVVVSDGRGGEATEQIELRVKMCKRCQL
jgi:hypothetical protein